LKGLRVVDTGQESWVVFEEQWIQSYGESGGCAVSIKCALATGLRCVVPAKELTSTISKMSREEITLTTKSLKKDGTLTPALIANDGQTKLTLFGLDNQDKTYTKLMSDIASLKLDEQVWQPIPVGFNEGLSKVMLSSGSDKRLGKLAGVAFQGDSILSTDNYVVGLYRMEREIRPELMKIETGVAKRLSDLKGFDFFAFSNQWFYAKNSGGIVMATRLLPADYSWDKVAGIFDILKFSEAPEQEFPEDLVYAIDRVQVMAGDSEIDNTTQISLSERDGSLIVQSKRNSGEIETAIPWGGNLPGIILVSPEYLKTILSETRKFKVSPIKKGLLFEVPKFKHLVMVKCHERSLDNTV